VFAGTGTRFLNGLERGVKSVLFGGGENLIRQRRSSSNRLEYLCRFLIVAPPLRRWRASLEFLCAKKDDQGYVRANF
jgi:hypothetical protein